MAASLLQDFTEHMSKGNNLGTADASAAADALASGDVEDDSKRAFLEALADKGETPEEIFAIADNFRNRSISPGLDDVAPQAIDIVGTGGDHSGSFNISTTAALVTAASGVPVIKHGNRSITSRSGSADFLEALGIPLEIEEERRRKFLRDNNFCFLFAPAFHPAFKFVGPVRKAMAADGRRSVFNLLGPLLNPARPAFELMGVFESCWVAPMAVALEKLGLAGGVVACCELDDGEWMDELTTAGENRVVGFGAPPSTEADRAVARLNFPGCNAGQLRGGSVSENLRILEYLMDGSAPAGLEDSVCLNAGVAIWITGKHGDLATCIEIARETLTEGTLKAWIKRLKSHSRT